MEKTKIRVEVELVEPMLGTVPKDADVYSRFVASKAPDAGSASQEEQSVPETVDEIEAKGWTGFHTDESGIFIYDYMVRGQIKSGLEMVQANGAKKIPAYKKWVDNLIFVFPRKIYLGLKEPSGYIERPLRAMGAQGPRVCVTRSDKVDAGHKIAFEVVILTNNKGLNEKNIREALEFGQFVGYGQWRGSGGYGRFKVIRFDVK